VSETFPSQTHPLPSTTSSERNFSKPDTPFAFNNKQ
jgi:hypothetical protein